YFPAALAVKMTVPVLVAAAVVLVFRPKRAKRCWPMLAAGAMLLFSLNCRVQIGVRLQFPLIAFTIIGCAVLLTRWRESAGAIFKEMLIGLGCTAGVAWMAISHVTVWPHELCYVNELWGGPDKGYELVSDANYDWGQGLKDLAKLQREFK